MKVVIECECGNHLLNVEHDVDFHGENNEFFSESFYMAMFSKGSRGNSWKHRLKTIWHVITKGEAYRDQLCLSPEEAKRLADFINQNILTPTP